MVKICLFLHTFWTGLTMITSESTEWRDDHGMHKGSYKVVPLQL